MYKSTIKILILSLLLSVLYTPIPVNAALLSRPPTNLGLVGYWPMDEGVGLKSFDTSGQNNTGTITGATWTNGKHGKALSFNGSSSYVDAGTSSRFDLSASPFTVGAWVNLNAFHWSSNFADRLVIKRTDNNNAWQLTASDISAGAPNNQFNLVIKKSGVETIVSTGPVLAGVWYYVVGVSDGSNLKIYLNGVLQGANSGPTGFGVGTLTNLYIGARTDSNSYANGKIDDVRIYNRALTATEISKLYSSGEVKVKQANNNGLVGYWSMNEGRGTIATDSSGLRNNGTITGATWTDGKHGKGLSFNGASNKIDAGNNSSLQLTTGTISAWVKTTNAGASYRGVVAKQLAYGMFLNANEFGIYDWGSATWRGSGYSPNDGKWHFLSCTFQSGVTNGTFCYADGILKLTTTITISNQTVSLQIAEANASQYFNGSLDDVRVYNRALSASEVAGLYQSGSKIENAGQNNKLTNGLVGLWSFNAYDISGTTAYDRSGQGNNATLTNMSATTSPVAGKVGQGLKFDGVDDLVNIGAPAVLNLSINYTLSFWIKPSPSFSGTLIRLSESASNSPNRTKYQISVSGSGVQFTNGDGTLSDSDPFSTSIPSNTWTLITCSLDANNIKACYKNGVLISTSTNTVDSSIMTPVFGYIGTNRNLVTYDFFEGTIDEVRIYNRALSADEVKQLYRMGQ